MAKTPMVKYECRCCKGKYIESNYYRSFSKFFNENGKIPYCKQCIEKFYQYYFDIYTNEGCLTPERNAIKRVCMALDIYYSEKNFTTAMNKVKESDSDLSPMGIYMRTIFFVQYKDKTYDNTEIEEEKKRAEDERKALVVNSLAGESGEIIVDPKTVKFFGSGFTDEDYDFLQEQYSDWTARHECNTKAQEEVFKRLCFKQLEILKATRRGDDTKNLDATFQNLLETAKLQPKQNAGETVADAQTFGTLIDKWENTRPIPEVDEEFKDVDKIGLLIHTFFTGHIAKVLNLPSSLSALYDKFIKKYTVEQQEYSSDSDNEALFNSIFGKKNIDEQNELFE